MNKVAYWRAKKGLTIRALAAQSGIKATSISRIEKGHVKPYLSTLGRLATALNIDVTDLMDQEETETPPPSPDAGHAIA